jgi:hypothetical protein
VLEICSSSAILKEHNVSEEVYSFGGISQSGPLENANNINWTKRLTPSNGQNLSTWLPNFHLKTQIDSSFRIVVIFLEY